jgi:hypothetical protein
MRSSTFFEYLKQTVKPPIYIDSGKTSIHTSVIVLKGEILAATTNKVGYRSRKTRIGSRYSERNSYPACTIHAEIAVLRLVGDVTKLRGADMYVWRLSSSQEKTLNSKPCSECQCVLEKCIREYGLRHVYYSVSV